MTSGIVVEEAANVELLRCQDHVELCDALELACRVVEVARALTWERALRQARSDELDASYATAPIRCLHSLLDDSHLGGA